MKNNDDKSEEKKMSEDINVRHIDNIRDSTTSDIEMARLKVKQQVKLKRKKRLITLTVVTAVVVLILTVFKPIQFIRGTFNNVLNFTNKNDFPISADFGVEKYIEHMGNDVFIVTDTGQYFLNKNGNIFNKSKHNYSDVDYDVNNDNFVLYQFNSENFIKGEKNKESENIDIGMKILNATISSDKKTAVVVPSGNYLNEVAVFNQKNEEIYRWFSANEYVSSIKFNDNGEKLFVNTVSAENGHINSHIYILNFNDTKEEAKVTIPNTTIVDFTYNSGKFIVIAEKKVFSIDLKSNIEKEYTYTNKSLISYEFIGNNIALILSGGRNTGISTIKVLDTQLKEYANFEYNKNIDDTFIDESGIYIASNNNISIYSLKGALKKEIIVDFYFSDFIKIDNSLILLGNSRIEKLKIK